MLDNGLKDVSQYRTCGCIHLPIVGGVALSLVESHIDWQALVE